MRVTALLALVLPLSATPAAATGEVPLKEREAPSAVVRWTGPSDARAVLLSGETLFVRTARGAAALKLSDGGVRWETPLAGSANAWGTGPGPVLAEGRVAFGVGSRVDLLDPLTGRVEASAAAGGSVQRLVGPDLVAVVEGPDGPELLRVDPRTGAVLARRPVGTLAEAVEQSGVLVTTAFEEPGVEVAGLDASSLSELWSFALAGAPELVRLDGKLHVTALGEDPDAADARILPLDARSGTLGPPLPSRPLSEGYDFAWDLRVRKGGTSPESPESTELFRISPKDGSSRWSLALPCDPRAWWREEDDFTFACLLLTGRHFLIRLDLGSGRVLRVASGIRAPAQLVATRKLVVVLGADGHLEALDASAEGPAEAATVSLAEAVARILGTPEGPMGFAASVREEVARLRELGPAALPLVAGHVPSLPPLPLAAACRFLAEGRYRAAGRAIAARLARGGDLPEPVVVELLQALADVGSEAEAAGVASILEDANRPLPVRRAALGALAGIGSPGALAAVDRALRRPKPSRAWYAPPAPPSGEGIERAGAAVVPLGDGSRLTVFRSPALGNEGDLWISRGNAPASFLGVSVPPEVLASASPLALSARLEGDELEVRLQQPRPETLFRGSLSGLSRDSDGDGLPDLVERRLLLDPEDPDTDGDGIPDALDLVPNAAPRAAQGEREEIAAALFTQVFGLETGPPGPPLLLVSDAPLAFTGRSGATIVVPVKRAQALRASAGYEGMSWLRFGPLPDTSWEGRPLAEDERLWSTSTGSGPELVLVRKVSGRWFLVKVLAALVS